MIRLVNKNIHSSCWQNEDKRTSTWIFKYMRSQESHCPVLTEQPGSVCLCVRACVCVYFFVCLNSGHILCNDKPKPASSQPPLWGRMHLLFQTPAATVLGTVSEPRPTSSRPCPLLSCSPKGSLGDAVGTYGSWLVSCPGCNDFSNRFSASSLRASPVQWRERGSGWGEGGGWYSGRLVLNTIRLSIAPYLATKRLQTLKRYRVKNKHNS